jgi:hypothetical protein
MNFLNWGTTSVLNYILRHGLPRSGQRLLSSRFHSVDSVFQERSLLLNIARGAFSILQKFNLFRTLWNCCKNAGISVASISNSAKQHVYTTLRHLRFQGMLMARCIEMRTAVPHYFY